MGKLVVLKLGDGSFEQGFPVTLQIGEDGASPSAEIAGKLPPNSEIPQYYSYWQSAYYRLGLRTRLEAAAVQVTNVSVMEDCHNAARMLCQSLNAWLNSVSFRAIKEKFLEKLMPSDAIRVILQTENSLLQRLPWHQSDLFARYPKAEIALAAPAYDEIVATLPQRAKIRILAVLGSSVGIDTHADRLLLENLPDADVCFLVEPPRRVLDSQLWAAGGWDILFFAGHSASVANCEVGRIYINQNESLTISDLKNALHTAVENGLKLAIFNSCDGLGLARELAGLQIPQVVLMREPVPDRVAQEFLKNFLQAFSGGKSLYLSVREARERLQGWESEFPCASWLPIIYQNPTALPPIWREWVWRDRPKNKRSLATVLLSSLAVTACVIGVRLLGMLQGLELQAYDRLMQLRPESAPDPRLLVVTVTEQDLRLPEQKNRKGSLSDLALERLLQKLEPLKPRVIGLDIYRDFAVEPEYAALSTQLRQNQRFVAVCGVRDSELDPDGVAAPPEVPTERLGFSDVAVDSDKIIRRHLLTMTPNPASRCPASYAFNLQLAFRYLKAEGISPKFTSNQELQLGNTVFKRLEAHSGGYQNFDEGGYQLLLNNRSLDKIAPQVTLTQVLTGQINPNSVKDRIVLIGTTAPSFNDFLSTPYHQKMPGVFVQAQMVSEILSAVLDRQSTIWVLPLWSEVVWIFAWSIVGGLLTLRFYSLRLWLSAIAALTILLGICFGILTRGGWIPLVPPALALVATSVSAIAIGESHTSPQQKTFLYPSPEL